MQNNIQDSLKSHSFNLENTLIIIDLLLTLLFSNVLIALVRFVGSDVVERNAEHVADNGLSGIQSVQCLLEIISMGGGVNILADFVHTRQGLSFPSMAALRT